MKKLVSLTLALALVLGLSACGSGGDSGTASTPSPAPATQSAQPQADPVEVVVFAAASLEATLTQIAQQYKTVAPEVTLTFNFDSSGTLRTQIKEGAVCDLFLSAGQSQMNELDAADTSGKNADGTDLVYPDTRINLVENKVVLAVPDDNPAGISSFSDLATDKLSLLCIGNEDVPVGSYSLQILESLGIDIAQLEADGKVTYASNVTEVANQVKEGAVDCGIIYATDAFTYGLTVVDQATADLCGQVIYPAAVMNSGSEGAQAAAQAFLEYLHTDAGAVSVLEGVGRRVHGAYLFPGHSGRLLCGQNAQAGEGRAGCGADPASGAPPHRGGVLPAAASGAEAAHRPVVSGDLFPAADHGVVRRHLCLRGGGLSPDVPHRPGGL